MPEERYLIVVSILAGRSFPKRPHHKLIIDAKFDGELLSTDPVNHTSKPSITQELAWQLTKKGLQQHRLHRSSMKIQCYAYDTQSTVKEMIGYVLLDFRAATMKQASKWYPLLHCKYMKSKPELQLGLYLDHDVDEVKKIEEMQTNLTTNLRPILDETGSFYQIGPVDCCQDIFILAVTIVYASNLALLIPAAIPLPDNSSGYSFYYSLFGNNVCSETFTDLINPKFVPERASVKIRSNLDVLCLFFANQPGIQVHFCCEDISFGHCEVPLNTLLKPGSTEIFMRPVVLEGDYTLLTPNKTKVSTDSPPVVGISVALWKEEMKNVKEVIDQQQTVSEAPKKSTEIKSDVNYSDTFEDKTSLDPSSLQESQNTKETQNPKPVLDAQTTSNTQISSKKDNSKAVPAKTTTTTTEVEKNSKGNSESSSQPHVVIPAQFHHFTFSIDLTSIAGNQITNIRLVFLRYVYPFFGSAAPILTHPPVKISKGTEVFLPHSFCAFDFASMTDQLHETFLSVPLFVEVWERDRNLSKDVLLGICRLPLAKILTAEKTRIVDSSNGNGWRQVHKDTLVVSSADEGKQKIATLTVVLTLEDWGAIHDQRIILNDTSSQVHSVPQENSNTNANKLKNPEKDLRETKEYQVAMELEIWKEAQKQKFENELKQKEISYMRVLADEWKKRDREREVVLKKKLSEYNQLEETLQKALKDLAKKEQELTAKEKEVVQLRNDQNREHERKLAEMKEASQRLQDDCEHRIQLERVKTSEYEGLVSKYKQELLDAEKRYTALSKEFSIFKEQENSKPEVRLQSEINILTVEKVELEKKLDNALKSKIHYKQQWGRALKEVARLKHREQVTAKAQLKKQQDELEQIKLRYLANEEKESIKSDKLELEVIKNELNKIRLAEEQKQQQPQQQQQQQQQQHLLNQQHSSQVIKNQMGQNPHSYHNPSNASLDEHVARLIEERDILLRTGVYTSQDKIIAELDQQIKDIVALRNT
ncbi:centrosomal protein of 120 kDa-like isoform X2 [Octopus sinensis]|uniref:Centrosomal protein of 120 kDa-like isoform X2 n=1 Tax=Octopus sinensis TaxID=2607531 RepID=A0A6P7U715_9MOLL|nr:centrosomal protein of 120 kDa-like isoform X2 [Octopus sinensis]